MLKNLPNKIVFEKLGMRLFLFCLDQFYFFDNYLTHILEAEEEISEKNIFVNDYINQNQEQLYAILILLFQSIENYLKKEICTESPYLIISSNPEKWDDKEFSELHLHGFDSLLKIYSEIKEKKFTQTLKDDMNSLKKIRNSIVHGVYSKVLLPEEIAKYIFIFLHDFWENSWLNEVKPYIPYEEFSGSDTVLLWRYLHLFKKYLGIDKTCDLLNIAVKSFYECPECSYSNMGAYNITDECNFAYFLDNKKKGKSILFCPICQNEFYLSRLVCTNKECSSTNVVSNPDWGDFCLDCLEFLDRK